MTTRVEIEKACDDRLYEMVLAIMFERENEAINMALSPKPKGKQHIYQQGEKVEYRRVAAATPRVGIVTSYSGLTHIVQVVDFITGQLFILAGEDCVPCHGYLHIDRPERQAF